MPYSTPNFAALREAYLRDLCNLDADAHSSADSDNFIRASATASAVEGLYAHQLWITRQILPDTADPEYLEWHAGLRGIVRKAATLSTGTLTFTGTAEALIPAGTQVKDATGLIYQSTAPVILPSARTVIAPCASLQVGALPDCSNAIVTLLRAPAGVQSKAVLTLAGGTDAESDASLLARLLYYMRNPPGGGNAADYQRWAMEVPGVTGASVYPLRQGPGTVDIVIAGEDGIPSADVVRACQAHIDSLRPCTAKASTVYAPKVLDVPITLRLRVSGSASLQSLRPSVETVLRSQFALIVPGGMVVLAKLLAAVAGLSGVADAALTQPTANVQATGLQWPRLGTLSLETL